MEKEHALYPYLKRIRWRLRLVDGLSLAQQTLWISILVSIAALVLLRIFPIEIKNLLWIPFGVWLVGIAIFTLLHPVSLMSVSRRADRELQLKERLSSSIALENEKSSPVYQSFTPALVSHAHQDALQTVKNINLKQDFPLHVKRRSLYLAGSLFALALPLFTLPNPMEAVIAEKKAVVEATRQQASQIEKAAQKIADDSEMSPEEREELLRKLAEIAEKLRANPGDREQALADLSRLEEELKDRLDPKGDQRRAALEAMAAQLQALAKDENPQIGDLLAAANAAEKISQQLDSMSNQEREALAQQLAQMASRAAQAGDSFLAQSLASMAQAAQSGDNQAAHDAAQQVAQALQKATSSMADQQELNRAISQVQGSRQALSRAGQPGQQAQQGSQQGQGPGQGSGQGNQAGGGGGTNTDSLPPSSQTGKAGQPQGQSKDPSFGNLDSQVYVPRDKLQGINRDELFISGQDSGQGETQSSEKPDPSGGVYNPALVPYNAVYQQYLNAANQAIDHSAIPPGLKDYIRAYFIQLEP